MTEKELLEIKKILGIDDLKNDIHELQKQINELDHKLTSFWYKVALIIISAFITFIVYGHLSG